MTESIFVPFKLTTQESCEKVYEVLSGDVTAWGCDVKPATDDVELQGEELFSFAQRLKAKAKGLRLNNIGKIWRSEGL